MRSIIPFLILFGFLFIIDLVVYKGLRNLFQETNPKIRTVWYVFHWSIPALVLIGIAVLSLKQISQHSPNFRFYFVIFGVFILFYVPKLLFIVFYVIQELVNLLRTWFGSQTITEGEVITRGNFITKIGIVLAAIPFMSIIHGIFKGRYQFNIVRNKIPIADLPEIFDGFRIIQLSDIHMGSFARTDRNIERIKEAVKLINAERPDIIVFTGDLVNNVAGEMRDWVDIWKEMDAQIGKYSILGNHDYGDYVAWSSDAEKYKNLERLKNYHKEMGFKLLLNDSVILGNQQDKIALLGVENWGQPPFPQYGDLNKAMQGVENIPTKILLSHDPTHWEVEVKDKIPINLTLSGHTHGFQFAIKVGDYSWSPVKWKYKYWRGLYQSDNQQYLYVNIGFGFLGFPGRVGTDPEISLFELEKS